MERITIPGYRYHNDEFMDSGVAKFFNRLSAYEDSGLEPQDIISAVDMAKIACALHELNAYKDIGPIDHLRDLLQAENEGRLVVLPCKVGDTVYSLSYSRGAQKHFVAERKVEEILYCSNRGVRPCIICCFGGWRFDNCDIGKTVFLTREEAEAEAALKGDSE